MAKAKTLTLSDEDVVLLNTKTGVKHLLATPETDVETALRMTRYELEMRELQAKLVDLQGWVIREKKRIIIIFEGRDAAGKGGAVRQLTSNINPRHYNTYALPAPTEDERGQWYFQRYVSCLPNPGEMAFFDRSWYNRAIVEPVNGFCTEAEYACFMEQVNDFERMLVSSGVMLIKFYFSINKAEQARRFKAISKNPLTKWQMSAVDQNAQKLWKTYTTYEDRMFAHTNTPHAPWVVIDANESTSAHLTALRHVLNTVPYVAADAEA